MKPLNALKALALGLAVATPALAQDAPTEINFGIIASGSPSSPTWKRPPASR